MGSAAQIANCFKFQILRVDWKADCRNSAFSIAINLQLQAAKNSQGTSRINIYLEYSLGSKFIEQKPNIKYDLFTLI